MGNVDSQTLIKKLTKTGKHAELWPQKADSKKKKQGKSENKKKQSDQEAGEDSNQTSDNENEAGNEGYATGKSVEQFQETELEQEQTVTVLAGNQPSVAEKKVSFAVQGGNENGTGNEKSGSGSKKKKKKGQKRNNSGNWGGGGGQSGYALENQAHVQAHSPVSTLSPANQIPPRHHICHQFQPDYYVAPVCTVSCHPFELLSDENPNGCAIM